MQVLTGLVSFVYWLLIGIWKKEHKGGSGLDVWGKKGPLGLNVSEYKFLLYFHC